MRRTGAGHVPELFVSSVHTRNPPPGASLIMSQLLFYLVMAFVALAPIVVLLWIGLLEVNPNLRTHLGEWRGQASRHRHRPQWRQFSSI
jgi:hypothetical protein